MGFHRDSKKSMRITKGRALQGQVGEGLSHDPEVRKIHGVRHALMLRAANMPKKKNRIP